LDEGTKQAVACLTEEKITVEEICDVNMEDLTKVQQYCQEKDCKDDAAVWSQTKCF
jgi:hypothetical protein